MEVTMWLAITGGILAGIVGLGALYDYVAKRRGERVSFGGAPGTASFTAQSEHNTLRP
jgi:hypothetical protein